MKIFDFTKLFTSAIAASFCSFKSLNIIARFRWSWTLVLKVMKNQKYFDSYLILYNEKKKRQF